MTVLYNWLFVLTISSIVLADSYLYIRKQYGPEVGKGCRSKFFSTFYFVGLLYVMPFLMANGHLVLPQWIYIVWAFVCIVAVLIIAVKMPGLARRMKSEKDKEDSWKNILSQYGLKETEQLHNGRPVEISLQLLKEICKKEMPEVPENEVKLIVLAEISENKTGIPQLNSLKENL